MRGIALAVAIAVALTGRCGLAKCLANMHPFYDGVCGYADHSDNKYTYYPAFDKCEQMGAFLPSIHSEKENTQFYTTATTVASAGNYWNIDGYGFFWLGLQCKNNSYTWTDGTAYSYNKLYAGYSCDESQRYEIMTKDYKFHSWEQGSTDRSFQGIACTIASAFGTPCDDFDQLSSGSCLKLVTGTKTWSDAEAYCRLNGANLVSIHSTQENDYVRRSAVAHNLMNGVHIGLQNMNPKAPNFTWTDGSYMNFSNYVPGFPNAISGDCGAMEISFQSGKWVNVDCTTKLPFFCSRQVIPKPVQQPSGCPNASSFSTGDHIYSPSYPSKVEEGYCEYIVLASSSSSKVALRVEEFNVNYCCHNLVIYDGVLGSKVIATLTGHVAAGTNFTATGPELRVVWNVTTPGKVEGWHFSVFQVDSA